MLVTDRPVTDWLKPVAGQPGAFRTTGVGADVTLAPFYRMHRRIYTAYWDLLTPAENAARLKAIEAERERVRRLEAATIALLRADRCRRRASAQPAGRSHVDRPHRTAGPAGGPRKWFSYDLPLDRRPAGRAGRHLQPRQSPRPQLRGPRRRRARRARSTSAFDSESRFFDREYALPPALVQGKTRLTIRFQVTGTNEIAPVYGMRLIRGG